MDGNTHGIRRLTVVLEKEIDDGDGDTGGEKDADRGNENHQGVHVGRKGGRFRRIQWQLRLHGASVLLEASCWPHEPRGAVESKSPPQVKEWSGCHRGGWSCEWKRCSWRARG